MIRTVILVVLALAFFGCGDEGPPEIPQGSAGFWEGKILAPGGQILVRGESFENEAPAGLNQLAVVSRDDGVYFYHPRMGIRELSTENSRRAIAWFAADPPVLKQALTEVPANVKTLSAGGLEVLWSEDTTTTRFENQARRWSVVTSDLKQDGTYIAPRGDEIPTSFTEALLEEVAGDLVSTSVAEIPVDVNATTFHGFVRGIPALATSPEFAAGISLAYAMNREAVETVNMVDAVTVMVQGAEAILGFVPFECIDAIVFSSFKALQVELIDSILGGASQELKDTLYQERSLALLSEFLGCAQTLILGAFTGGVGAVAVEAFSFFNQTVAMLNFVFDNTLIGAYQTTKYAPFDQVTLDRQGSDFPVIRGIRLPDLVVNRTHAARIELDVDRAKSVQVSFINTLISPELPSADMTSVAALQVSEGRWAVNLELVPQTPTFGYHWMEVRALSASGFEAKSSFYFVVPDTRRYVGSFSYSYVIGFPEGAEYRCDFEGSLELGFKYEGGDEPEALIVGKNYSGVKVDWASGSPVLTCPTEDLQGSLSPLVFTNWSFGILSFGFVDFELAPDSYTLERLEGVKSEVLPAQVGEEHVTTGTVSFSADFVPMEPARLTPP